MRLEATAFRATTLADQENKTCACQASAGYSSNPSHSTHSPVVNHQFAAIREIRVKVFPPSVRVRPSHPVSHQDGVDFEEELARAKN